MDIKGVFVAVAQPFADGEVSVDQLVQNIARLKETGVAGFLILGSTGEFVFLNERERFTVVEAARDAIPAEMGMIVGVGMESARNTTEFANRVSELGADLALCVTPYYFKDAMTPTALASTFTSIADNISLPLLLFNFPQCTGVNLDSDTVAKLSEHQNVVGTKDSSNDLVQLCQIRRKTSIDFKILAGHGGLLLPALHCGVDGAILAMANLAPDLCVGIYESFRAGDFQSASRKQVTLSTLEECIVGEHGIPGIKFAMDLRGYKGGLPRLPLMPLAESAKDEITRVLRKASLL